MKMLLFYIVLLSAHNCWAQTLVEKTIVDPRIKFIEIDATNCFEVAMETTDEKEMRIGAKIDGEYQKDLLLKVKKEGKTLQVGAGFQPNFKNPNDKLSAHKVVSIALHIRLPKGKRVALNGTSANVTVTGNYRKLAISLNDGQCSLEKISEAVTVRTQSGDISVFSEQARILAESKYGVVHTNSIPDGNNRYVLKTVTGNIHFSKTE